MLLIFPKDNLLSVAYYMTVNYLLRMASFLTRMLTDAQANYRLYLTSLPVCLLANLILVTVACLVALYPDKQPFKEGRSFCEEFEERLKR